MCFGMNTWTQYDDPATFFFRTNVYEMSSDKSQAYWKTALDDIKRKRSPASEVVDRVRRHYKTPCSRKSKVSLIRSKLSPKQRKLVKPNKKDIIDCAALSKKNMASKLKNALKFNNDELLEHATSTLASKTAGTYDLALALMTVTGRRSSEILNGRSSFGQVRGKKTHALFKGQLKKRKTESDAYTIPLLCTRELVNEGLDKLRARQPRDIQTYSPARVSRRYQSSIRKHSLKHPVYKQFNNLHDLRGCYAVMAARAYDCGSNMQDQYAISKFLGHADPKEAMPYMAYRLKKPSALKKNQFGTFKIE